MRKQDIQTTEDVEEMVNTFYQKVNVDPLLSPIFNEYAMVNWEKHLPRMYAFWNSLIFSKGNYQGNPFGAHIPLPIDKTHFKRWLELFEETIDELYSGPVAENTKLRARSIAQVFESKLSHMHKDKK